MRFLSSIIALILLAFPRMAAAQTYPFASLGSHATTTMDFDDFLVYHPVTMTGPMPLLTWSNPTFFDSWSFDKLIRLQASYGMIVVASHSLRTGSGADAIAGIDLMLSENVDPASKFFGMINPDAIGAFGHSQGGAGTVNAVFKDARIKCTAPLHPGAGPNYPTVKRNNGPMLVITGQSDSFSSPRFCETKVYNYQSGPTILAVRRNATHYAPVSALGGDTAYNHYVTAWFLRYLGGRDDLASEFTVKLKTDTKFSKVLSK